MRIGFFTDRYYPTVDGVSVSVDLFAKELRKLGHEVFIFCPGSPQPTEHESAHVIRFRSFPSIWYEDYRDTMPFTPSIIRKVRACKLDIVHIHTAAQIGLLGMRIAREDGLPIVATHHTDIEQYIKVYKRIMGGFVAALLMAPALVKSRSSYRDALAGLKPKRSIKQWNKQVIREGFSMFYQQCDAVIAPSFKMSELLKSYGVETKKVTILPTGIDPNEAKLPSKLQLRQQYGITPNAPIVLFVGRLGEEKNIQLLLRAFAHNVKRYPDARLVIAGYGPYHDELITLSEDLGIDQSTTFTGSLGRADAFACYRSATVFGFPSLTDTQGLVINEACYSKKPVVYCDNQISPITIDGKTGLLAKPTVLDFAAKISQLIESPELVKELGDNARREAKKITIAKQAEKLEHLYRGLLDR